MFDNPRQDARLYLALEHRESVDGEQRRLTVSMGDRIAAQIEIRSGYEVQEIQLTRSLLGDADEVAVGLEVDYPFVPAVLSGEENTDDRVLGVRVMGAYLLVGCPTLFHRSKAICSVIRSSESLSGNVSLRVMVPAEHLFEGHREVESL